MTASNVEIALRNEEVIRRREEKSSIWLIKNTGFLD